MITIATIGARFAPGGHPESVWMGDQRTTTGLVAALRQMPGVVSVEPTTHAGIFEVATTDRYFFHRIHKDPITVEFVVRREDDTIEFLTARFVMVVF